MSKESLDARIAALASPRYGLFTRADALRAGATNDLIRRRLEADRWQRVRRGVYGLGGVPPSWRRSILAAILQAGDGARASHRSAGMLYDLAAVHIERSEIIVPMSRRLRTEDVLVHRVSDLKASDLTVVDAIPVTSAARTLIDLAGVVAPEILEDALDDALRHKLLTIRWLRWRIEQLAHPGHKGIALLDRLCRERDGTPGTESALEDRFERLVRRAGLPEPVRQHPVSFPDGRRARIDFAYPDLLLGIEVDGFSAHSGRSRWQHDLTRGNDLLVLGWDLLHFTAEDVDHRPAVVVRTVEEAVAARKSHLGTVRRSLTTL